MSTERSSREQELLSEGWTKQFCASGSRLQEAAELYRSIGLEVHFEPLREEDLDCSECLQGAFGDCAVIYTRPGKKAKGRGTPDAHREDEDLW
ncbi:MAG: hypothetical protein ACE5JU_11370 [Candidatus Binatia bacterium]